jgi:hypothetical protein
MCGMSWMVRTSGDKRGHRHRMVHGRLHIVYILLRSRRHQMRILLRHLFPEELPELTHTFGMQDIGLESKLLPQITILLQNCGSKNKALG